VVSFSGERPLSPSWPAFRRSFQDLCREEWRVRTGGEKKMRDRWIHQSPFRIHFFKLAFGDVQEKFQVKTKAGAVDRNPNFPVSL